MAFQSKDMVRTGGAYYLGRSTWVYSTTDAIGTVDDTDYFTGAKYLGMKVGDPVTVIKTDGVNIYMAAVSAIDADGNATLTTPLEIVG